MHNPNVPVHESKKRFVGRSKKKQKIVEMYRDKGILSHKPAEPAVRIQPDRRWFGNTRTITQEELAKFRDAYTEAKVDQFQVILHERKLPKSLLIDSKEKPKQFDILKSESFDSVFGKKATRLHPVLETTDLSALVASSEARLEKFEDTEVPMSEARTTREVELGQTKRVMGEVYKVIDSSHVIVEILDARDPLGTRSRRMEDFIIKECPHKHLIFLVNKCDLVPRWVVEKAVRVLSKERPTLAFRASTQGAFGLDQLLGLLRQFRKLHKEHGQLCVGFVGYPNVGKSSVINSLRREKVCPVAPIPGETKVWRYVALTKKIYLIDCPGHVYPDDISETERVLRGVTRDERLEDPDQYIPAILERVKPQYIARQYGIDEFGSADEFLAILAQRLGRLLKGGRPDIQGVSRIVIRDFQRGKLPWFVVPRAAGEPEPAPVSAEAVVTAQEVALPSVDLVNLDRTVAFDEEDMEEPAG